MYYLEANRHGPAANYPITRIVMHGTVTPCIAGGARAVANMFHRSTRDASTQYVVDPGEVVQCVHDDTIAYGAPPNTGAIHVEQCDPQGGSTARWQDAAHQSMLRLAANLVASLCLKYNIPIKKISSQDLLAGKRGICGHADVTYAWHQTDHIDPGPDYPWNQFIALVQEAAHPTPAPTPERGKPMFAVSTKSTPAIYVSDGIYRRWINGRGYYDFLVNLGMQAPPSSGGTLAFEFDTVAGMEAVAGPLAPGTVDYVPPVTS